MSGGVGGRKIGPPHPDGVLANVENYDMSPMGIAKEKVIVCDDKGGFTGSAMAILIGRMREKKIPVSRLGNAIGRRIDWVLGMWNNRQRTTTFEELVTAFDCLGLEVVVRLKNTGAPVRSSRSSSLKAAKLLAEQKTAVQPDAKVIVVEVEKARHDRAGVISAQQRADIDRMLATR